MNEFTITWEDPTGQSSAERWTSQHLFPSMEAAITWAVQDGSANKHPVGVQNNAQAGQFLYTHEDCRYDDICGCESLKGLLRWEYHLLALPITRTTAKRIYYRWPEGHWHDDEIEHYIDRAKFEGKRRHDHLGEAWVRTSGTTGYHLFLSPNKPEWFYDHADETW